MSPVIDIDDLDRGENSHQFIGADHDVPVSMFLVHSAPGKGPSLHRHPYPELFIVEGGQATFRVGEDVIVADAGKIVIAPAGTPHAFTNTGPGELRMVNIHTASQMQTEWLED
ncbi:MAG: cupin domain-containing protein [Gaiellales bacterium]|jgi:quercetin dioxygenase-like cupin family protein